ncbi:hypothetical protein NITUZ_60220 [Candidatus Nitrosotenuis uzonensis]|uniref:Uncharacterized protein n=1 Tax=Candidatus Nitrosotenuis uzonensis TaxID=1407055 RepID=V6AVS2_9ARCH|nr:hypothetical protein NITUZ_60220 [Candidatus Nitrosotenuis uzonensis]
MQISTQSAHPMHICSPMSGKIATGIFYQTNYLLDLNIISLKITNYNGVRKFLTVL